MGSELAQAQLWRTHWPSGSHSSPEEQLQPATQLSSSPRSSGSPVFRLHTGAHSWYFWPLGHRIAGHRDTGRSGAQPLLLCHPSGPHTPYASKRRHISHLPRPEVLLGTLPEPLQSSWIPPSWEEEMGWGWLAERTHNRGSGSSRELRHPPGQSGEQRSTGHRQSLPGAQPHMAATQRRWNGSLSTSPGHSLGDMTKWVSSSPRSPSPPLVPTATSRCSAALPQQRSGQSLRRKAG